MEWFNIGLNLSVGHDTLSNIKSENQDNSVCLREMLAHRLKSGTHPLTYRKICKCLRHALVNRDTLALKLEKGTARVIGCYTLSLHALCPVEIQRSEAANLPSVSVDNLNHNTDLYGMCDSTIQEGVPFEAKAAALPGKASSLEYKHRNDKGYINSISDYRSSERTR